MPKRILLIGDSTRAEFDGAREWLRSHGWLIEAASVSEALRAGARASAPDAVLLVQSYPGQWGEPLVEELHRAWPLARLVMLLGSWCEGETRTGHPCCGVWRMFWYDIVPALERSEAESSGAQGSWSLPRLATSVERLAWDLEHSPRPGRATRGLVVIAASKLAAYESWQDACAAGGCATVWQRPGERLHGQGACAAIWDARDNSNDEWRRMREFARQWAPAWRMFAMGFPRTRDAQRAEELGAKLLPKPCRLPDLWWNLEQAACAASTIAGTGEVVQPSNCSTM